MVWPLDPVAVREFAARTRSHRRHRGKAPAARGSDPLDPLRDDERAAHRRQVFRRSAFDPAHGAPAIPNFGETTPELVAQVLARALRERDPDLRPRALPPRRRKRSRNRPAPVRSPGFCAGCPHNRSTRVPEGSRALAGIGCHTMAMLVEPDADDDRLAYGRRRRDVARPAAVHQPEPRLRQSRRRHLRPFRRARGPSGGRGRRADHLQDSLQRLRLDDRRTADRGRHDARPDPGRARRRGRQEDGAGGRRPGPLSRRSAAARA